MKSWEDMIVVVVDWLVVKSKKDSEERVRFLILLVGEDG